MHNIGLIEFAYGKMKYIFNSVLICESIYLAYLLFYFISKNGAIRIFDDKYTLQEDAFSYSYANFQRIV